MQQPRLDSIKRRIQSDRDAGRTLSLRDYLEAYPGEDTLVGRAYAETLDGESFDSPENHDRVGPYKTVKELGRGGQGVVYLAEDTRLHRKVALKVLTGLGPGSEETVQRFRREAEVASKLDHPGICGVHDAGTARGIPYIAMQYVEGATLSEWIAAARSEAHEDAPASIRLDRSPEGAEETADPPSGTSSTSSSSTSSAVTKPEILDILALFEKVARALHAAHEAGIVHRDIKPGNIMVTADGGAVILDFGLARAEDMDLQTLTRTGDLFGTPAYMSPEQLTRGSIRIDRRTDVYSLAASLYECLTLQRPFSAPTREGLYQAIMSREPLEARKLNPRVPPDLQVVLGTALEKDRDRRYQTALEFAEELRRVRSYEPIHARPPSQWGKARRWAQRNPAVAASLSLAFLFLIAGFLTALWLLKAAEAERDAKDEALKERTAAWTEKTRALAEKTEALEQYRQMSDVAKVEELIARERKLWPTRAALTPTMDSWLAEARAALGRRDAHRTALLALRQRALPYTAADEAEDARLRRARFPRLIRTLESARQELVKIDEELEAAPAATREALAEQRAGVQEKVEKLSRDERLKARYTWRFDDAADAWRHRVLGELVDALDDFEGTVEDVARRRDLSAKLRDLTLTDPEAKAQWDRCRADIARNPHYSAEARLDLAPQVGLVPLGRDKDSGLWEFWHWESGARPDWKGDALGGRSVMKPGAGIVFVLIPAGSFFMGAQKDDPAKPNHDPLAKSNEQPVTRVSLDAFFLSKYELTQGQWSRIMRERPRPSQYRAGTRPGGASAITDLNPVEQVSWDDCTVALERWDLVLPTEAQWEYAARAGTEGPWWCGATPRAIQGNGNLADAFAARFAEGWDCERAVNDGHVVHARVGSFAPNAFGLHDVLGNVWEICRDRFSNYGVAPRPGDGLRNSRSRLRVGRGGSFNNSAEDSRTPHRSNSTPDFRSGRLGCRPARSLAP